MASIHALEPVPSTNDWWAVQPLRSPLAPVVAPANATQPSHPIDSFILARLQQQQPPPAVAPEADPSTLIRRLTFDLLGLPPTPEEVAAFVAERSPDAYDRLVDRLLQSPHYGERWARHWMDAAHFAETHGNDQDRIRTNAWPYREYLIHAFNQDRPFQRFVEDQVAGDVLHPEDPQSTVALGFLAAGPWDESSLRDIREDTLDRQIARYLDRDDIVTTVMQTFTSTTVQCARCHDHKFDPISQRDYYALQSVFAGVDRANRSYDVDPAVHQQRRQLREEQERVARRDKTLLLGSSVRSAVSRWSASRLKSAALWSVVTPQTFVSAAGAELSLQPDQSILASGKHGPTDVYTVTFHPASRWMSAIRLELLTDDSLPHHGPGRAPNGNLHLSEVEVRVFESGSSTGRVLQIHRASSDYDQPGWTVNHAWDGDDKSAWGIYPRVGEGHLAVFELKEPKEFGSDAVVAVVLKQLHGGHCIGRFRLSTAEQPGEIDLTVVPTSIQALAILAEEQRSEDQQLELAAWVWGQELRQRVAGLPKPSLVYAAASDFEPDGGLKPSGGPRKVEVLRRGEVTKPIEEAFPGTLSCVSHLPARFELARPRDEGSRRAALARWLVDRENPLVWRSIVNRTWAMHFGRGLVESLNDFGRMGSRPSHPELLDWLAVWFRDEAQGSFKRLHRLIVTSAAYRRGGTESPMGDLTLWTHRVPLRLDGEQIRDAMLQASGQIDWRRGGPSDMQFDLKPGIHVTPKVDYTKFDSDQASGRRRGIYRFLFRTLPDPFMDALDCPAGDQLTPLRNSSVTVQQALALWNHGFVLRQCGHLANRVTREASTLHGQVERLTQLLLGRSPSNEEFRDWEAYASRHGLENLARVLMNSNEFVFVP